MKTQGTNSFAEWIASQPEAMRRKAILSLPPKTAEALLYDWRAWAREDQLLPDGDWRVWLILAGRGWGKTRTGAEAVSRWVREGKCRRLARRWLHPPRPTPAT